MKCMANRKQAARYARSETDRMVGAAVRYFATATALVLAARFYQDERKIERILRELFRQFDAIHEKNVTLDDFTAVLREEYGCETMIDMQSEPEQTPAALTVDRNLRTLCRWLLDVLSVSLLDKFRWTPPEIKRLQSELKTYVPAILAGGQDMPKLLRKLETDHGITLKVTLED